jgi:hypothetical protein
VFPVRYEPDLYIKLRINSVFKGLMPIDTYYILFKISLSLCHTLSRQPCRSKVSLFMNISGMAILVPVMLELQFSNTDVMLNDIQLLVRRLSYALIGRKADTSYPVATLQLGKF